MLEGRQLYDRLKNVFLKFILELDKKSKRCTLDNS